MKSVSVAVLKQQLSGYLHRVEGGEAFDVTAHRRPVARLVPHGGGRMEVRLPKSRPGTVLRVKGVRMTPGRSAVETLIEDRARR
jgi:antitoxin (DNA-binding transcriptional repressor) of toxin-antitoxin stability system